MYDKKCCEKIVHLVAKCVDEIQLLLPRCIYVCACHHCRCALSADVFSSCCGQGSMLAGSFCPIGSENVGLMKSAGGFLKDHSGMKTWRSSLCGNLKLGMS